MHEDLIGRLTFALEKQKAGAFSYLFSEAIAALSAQPDAGSGGDARAQVADGMLPPLPIAFFDEFGRGVDDRVRDYARSAIAARQPVGQGRVEELRDALGKVRLRCMFIGWPAESMWEATPGNWIPDWRYELQLMEHVLHGSEIRTPEKPTDTVPRNQLPEPAPAAVPVALQDIIGSMLNYAGVADTCEVTQGHAPVAIRNWAEMLQQLASPAAVPVDGEGWSGWATQYPGKMPVLHGAREIAELNYYPEEGQRLLYLATHPQPAAAKDDRDSARLDWLESDARHYGDGHNEPREVYIGLNWEQSPETAEWPGVRAAIDSAMAQQAKPAGEVQP